MQERIVAQFHESGGNISETARRLGISRDTVRNHLNQAGLYTSPQAGGVLESQSLEALDLPTETERVKRYILSSAQNNTKVNQAVLNNLKRLASVVGAELKISRFTYNTGAFSDRPEKTNKKSAASKAAFWYDPQLDVYSAPEGEVADLRLAPDLIFYDRANIIPTAERPLSGLETHYGINSLIVPHPKIALECVPTNATDPVKIMFTTGSVTQVNYIQKKAGMKAEWHHCYGGLLVEVDHEGQWWAWHVQCQPNGHLQFLDVIIDENGIVTRNNRVEAITPGDVHHACISQNAHTAVWGIGGLVEVLRPRETHLHDLYDNLAANRHDRASFQKRYERWLANQHKVSKELDDCAAILRTMMFDDMRIIVIRSNHDDGLERWLDAVDYKTDLPNAEIYLEAQLEQLRAMREKRSWMFLEWAMRKRGIPENQVQFLERDESWVVAGIECGNHGDEGINGTRGTPNGFVKIGRKLNIGHFHAPGIRDGVYCTGLLGEPDYRRGPNNHAAACIITYPSGKRTIAFLRGTQWRAGSVGPT